MSGEGTRQEHEPGHRAPRLYVASLRDYNAGLLHGATIEADADYARMEAEIAAMLAESPTARRSGQPAEEWAIHDHDGWGGIPLSEHESLTTLAHLAEGLIQHGVAYGAWVSLVGIDVALGEDFEDRYLGQFDSRLAFGESLLSDLDLTATVWNEVPEGLRPYIHIDVAGWVRDMELEGAIATTAAENEGIYVFYA